MNIVEELISLETAKLAREVGFNVDTKLCYIEGHKEELFPVSNDFKLQYHTDIHNFNDSNGYYSAPTQSILQKWIRIEHELHIRIDHNRFKNPQCKWGYNIEMMMHSPTAMKFGLKTYEAALEAGLLEALIIIYDNKKPY